MRIPEVHSTQSYSFTPDTVSTHNTPPVPVDTTGTRVDIVAKGIAPVPIDTDLPSDKVHPVWVQSAVLCDELAAYTIVINDTDQGDDNPANTIPETTIY